MIVKVLRYSAISSPDDIHPLENMKKLGLDNYYRASPEPVFDCWLFVYDKWPKVQLPSYIEMVELDDEKWPQLKKEIVENRQEMKRNFWYYFRWSVWVFVAICSLIFDVLAIVFDSKDYLILGLAFCVTMFMLHEINRDIDKI